MPATREYWPLVLEALKKSVSTSNYQAWFQNVEFVSTANHGRKIVLKVASSFNKDYIEKKFKQELKTAISRYYPQVAHIDYEIDSSKEENAVPLVQQEVIAAQHNLAPEELAEAQNLQKIADFLPKRNINNLNPKYTLENFVVNSSNELAVSVAKSIIKEPGVRYNPVFLYSGTGMGKTHLLQAIGQKLLEERPEFKIKYATLETFFNHFISSVQKNKGNDFRDYYRSVDLLLIDDIQFIRGKDATQEAFFHTFNELHQLNKQIVITSDRPPKSLEGIEDRLISRFEWGMVVDISKPNLEDRIAIFQRKLEDANISLKSEHVVSICQKVDSNIRDLEGVLNRIAARVKLLPDKELTEHDIQKIAGGYEFSSTVQITVNEKYLNTESIIDAVTKVFHVTKDDVVGSCREKNLAMARQVAMWLCKTELDMSFPTVGKFFGGRDHTTVMHACSKVEQMKNDDKLSRKILLVKQYLRLA